MWKVESKLSAVKARIAEKKKERDWEKRVEKQAYEEAYQEERIKAIKERGKKKAAERARAPTALQRVGMMVPKQPEGKKQSFGEKIARLEQKAQKFGGMGMGIGGVGMDFGFKSSDEIIFGKKPKTKTKKRKKKRKVKTKRRR